MNLRRVTSLGLCEIAGYCYSVLEAFDLLGCYTTYWLPVFHDCLLVPSSGVK